MIFTHLPDEELCLLLKEGNEKALQEIILRYWEPLYKMAAHTLEDLALCEDIVQELFIRIWNGRENLNLTWSLKAYLFACVRYEVYRQIKRQVHFASEEEVRRLSCSEKYNPQNQLEFEELMAGVEQIVQRLPEKCQHVYHLSRDKCLSHKEIAARLNISPKTVENQLTIALRRIRTGIARMLYSLFF